MASANCARYCSADIDFVDTDPATGLISMVALAVKLEQAERDGTLSKVVVPVHLYGTSCRMEPIAPLADCYGFSVLEDASHAIGGRYQGEPVGNCRYSAISVSSFHPVMINNNGEDVLASTNETNMAKRTAEMRRHGIT